MENIGEMGFVAISSGVERMVIGEKSNGGDKGKKEGSIHSNGEEKAGTGFQSLNPLLIPNEPPILPCGFFQRSGFCRYGQACRFSHNSPQGQMVNLGYTSRQYQVSEENSETVGRIECRFYLTPGGCRYGNACRFSHSHKKTDVGELAPSFRLPVKFGEKGFPQYMHTGKSKLTPFHPPIATSLAATSDAHSSSGISGSRSAVSEALQLPPKEPVASVDALESYMPVMLPDQTYPPRNGYKVNSDAPIPQQSQNIGTRAQSDLPNTRLFQPPAVPVSPIGLPLRPERPTCMCYRRFGLCKYGIGCQYDHPLNFGIKTSASRQSSSKSSSTPGKSKTNGKNNGKR